MAMEIDRSIELAVNGMTCGRCMRSVIEEFEGVRGVINAEIILNSGATSRVAVLTSKGVDDDALHKAITEAGLELVSIPCDF